MNNLKTFGMSGAVVHPHVLELSLQGKGAWRRRLGCDIPQRLGSRLPIGVVAALCRALRIRHGSSGVGEEWSSSCLDRARHNTVAR